MKYLIFFTLLYVGFTIIGHCDGKKKNKYSAEMNIPQPPTEKYDPDFRKLQRPFRMAKLNLVWSKAVHVSFRFSFIVPTYLKPYMGNWVLFKVPLIANSSEIKQ